MEQIFLTSSQNTSPVALATFNFFSQDRILADYERLDGFEPKNTYIIIHGYQNTGGNASNKFTPEQWMTNIATALWRRENNANIILVDWAKAAATLNYDSAAKDSQGVGQEIAQFLQRELIGYISDPSRVTLIGHSLGAQAAGAAGKVYQRDTGKKLGQIIGLDPAGPAFEVQGNLPALAPGDAQRVVALHTSRFLGYNNRLADFDIYTDIFINSSRFFPSTKDHSAAHTVLTQLLRGTAYQQSGQSINEFSLNTLVNSEYTGDFFDAQVTRPNDGTPLFIDKRKSNIAEILAGSISNDTLRGGVASDRISGGGGNDSLHGEAGNDLLHGGEKNDTLYGGVGDDYLFGDEGNDVLIGAEAGNTAVEIDFLSGRSGQDIFVLGTTATDFYLDSNQSNDPFNGNPFAGQAGSTGRDSFAVIQDYIPGEDFIQVRGPLSQYRLAPVSITLPLDIISGTGIYLDQSNVPIPNPFDSFLGFDNPAGVPLGESRGGELIGIVRNVLASDSTGFFNGNRFISLTNQSFISASNNTPTTTFAGDDAVIDDPDVVFTPEFASESQDLGSLVYNLDDFFTTETLTVQVEDKFLQQTDSFFHNLIGLYVVENDAGAILDTFDSNGNGRTDDLLNPEDRGYAFTAISNRVDNFYLQLGDSGNPDSNSSASELDDVILNGGRRYAPFVIANGGNLIPAEGTIDQGIEAFLAQNPNNQGATLENFLSHQVAYFSFGKANPEGTEHLQSRGNNVFGFEDLPGNLEVSDFDFNDAVFEFGFT